MLVAGALFGGTPPPLVVFAEKHFSVLFLNIILLGHEVFPGYLPGPFQWGLAVVIAPVICYKP
ncbi:MAG: hypothetical protein OQJ76_00375 [Rhodospirillales bacterium]|nr:hypothetical protein [Rhodospirillales bacterium]